MPPPLPPRHQCHFHLDTSCRHVHFQVRMPPLLLPLLP
jgi:hypothetical protein